MVSTVSPRTTTSCRSVHADLHSQNTVILPWACSIELHKEYLYWNVLNTERSNSDTSRYWGSHAKDQSDSFRGPNLRISYCQSEEELSWLTTSWRLLSISPATLRTWSQSSLIDLAFQWIFTFAWFLSYPSFLEALSRKD